MQKEIKESYGLIITCLEATIKELKSTLKEVDELDLKDSPNKAVQNTLCDFERLRDALESGKDLDAFQFSQLKLLMHYRLKVLNTQRQKLDVTENCITKFLANLEKTT